MIDWWGPVINEYCGGTESGGVVFHTAEVASRNPGTVGRPIVGGVVEIFDAQGRELASNTVGDVYMRLTGLADLTYNGMDHKRRKIERDGLMTCGDVRQLDDDGYLVLCDRRHGMVISGRVKHQCTSLYRAPATARYLGYPTRSTELLCACLETPSATPVSAEAGHDFLRPHLASYEIPKRIEGQSRVRIPARIFKRKLRDQNWETQRRQI